MGIELIAKENKVIFEPFNNSNMIEDKVISFSIRHVAPTTLKV